MGLLQPDTKTRQHKTTALGETKVTDPSKGLVTAIVNVSGNRDSDGDVVVPGASAYGLKIVTPKIVWSHDWKTPIGKSITAEEVFPGDKSLPEKFLDLGLGGLRIASQFNLKTQSGRDAFENVAFYGDEQQWSVGYEVHEYFIGGNNNQSEEALAVVADFASLKDVMEDNRPSRFITKWIVYEGSPVLFGANNMALTESVKDRQQEDDEMNETLEHIKVVLEKIDAKLDAPPENKAAIGVHHTGTSSGSWDGPANEKRVKSPNDGGRSYFGKIYAWQDADSDPKVKASYRFIHHQVAGDGTPGDANLTACSTGIGVLNGGRGGTVIPSSGRQGVYGHLAAHLRDADREPPPLKALDDLPEKYDALDELEIAVAYVAGDMVDESTKARLSRTNADRLRTVRDSLTQLLNDLAPSSDDGKTEGDGEDDEGKDHAGQNGKREHKFVDDVMEFTQIVAQSKGHTDGR